MAKKLWMHLSVLGVPQAVANDLIAYVAGKEKINGCFLITEGHPAYLQQGLPLGNLCEVHERSKEYAVYTSYVDGGKPTKRQLKAFQLIELLKEIR